jgi:cytochrome P450
MAGPPVVPWSIASDEFLLVTGHRHLKDVARDWRTFTSAVPFRVPIPPDLGGRTVAQLPLESDPPDTTEYRRIVEVPFSRAAAAAAETTVTAMTEALIDAALQRGELEVIDSFALPLFLRSLALVLGQPQSDATEWISWGRTVWEWSSELGRYLPNERMDSYIESHVDAALAAPTDDYFGLLASARLHGRPLTRDEMLGLANLTLAGGRDTTVAVIANALYYLAVNPDEFRRLREHAELVTVATEEFLRYYAPIHVLGRVSTTATELGGHPIGPGQLVGLGFAVANRDADQFDEPDRCRIDRRPNRHVTFGHGPHTCLGAPLARMVINVALRTLVSRVGDLHVDTPHPRQVELAPGVEIEVAPTDLTVRLRGPTPRETGRHR